MKAIYPGTFDPATNGHIDIIHRASSIVDRLVIGVLNNSRKNPLFSAEERVNHLKVLTEHMDNVEIFSFSGLLVNFAKEMQADYVIRGLRATTDFEYEFQMALTNRSLSSQFETLFIPASAEYLYLSSSVVKEVTMYGGNIDNMVPAYIKQCLADKFKER